MNVRHPQGAKIQKKILMFDEVGARESSFWL